MGGDVFGGRVDSDSIGLKIGVLHLTADLTDRDRGDNLALNGFVGYFAMGLFESSGDSQATARIFMTCSGVNFPGDPLRGAPLRTCPVERLSMDQVSRHSIAKSALKESAQRRRQTPACCRFKPTCTAISSLEFLANANRMIFAR